MKNYLALILIISLTVLAPFSHASSKMICESTFQPPHQSTQLPSDGWLEADLESALKADAYELKTSDGALGPITIQRIEEQKIADQVFFRAMLDESKRLETVARAKSNMKSQLLARFPESLRVNPESLKRIEETLSPLLETMVHSAEVGAWRLTLFDGRFLTTPIFTDYQTNSISPNAHFNKFLIAHNLFLNQIKRLTFFHTHQVDEPINRSISVSDLRENQALKQQFVRQGLHADVDVVAIADDGSLATLSRYGN